MKLAGLALVVATGSIGCGSGGRTPSTPSAVIAPTPAPTPTPTPPRTASLDASADHYQFSSSSLARLTSPRAFDISITPRRINDPFPSDFSHAVEVWLWHANTTSDNYTETAVCFSLVWEGNSHWRVVSFSPEGRWYSTRTLFDAPLGQALSVRVTKHAEGVAELFVNGVSLHSIEDKEPTRLVRARVVGTAADFTYVPIGLEGLSGPAGGASPVPCLLCAPSR